MTAGVSRPNSWSPGPGTLVLLSNLAAHFQHDFANAFRDLGWEVVWWGHEDERYFNYFVGDFQPPALVLYADAAGPMFPSLIRCPHPTAVCTSTHTDTRRHVRGDHSSSTSPHHVIRESPFSCLPVRIEGRFCCLTRS